MTDNVNVALPATVGAVSLIKHDSSTSGSLVGLGCVSSGSGNMVACSLHNGTGPNLVVYDGDGNRKWDSSLLNSNAYTSAPIISAKAKPCLIGWDCESTLWFRWVFSEWHDVKRHFKDSDRFNDLWLKLSGWTAEDYTCRRMPADKASKEVYETMLARRLLNVKL